MNTTTFNLPRVWLIFLLAIISVVLLMARPAEASEASKRQKFIAAYWDIVSDERMKALDILQKPQEDETRQHIYAVSYWDPETRVRSKAYKMLVNLEDRLGYISYLAAESFRLERDPDLRATKATLMEPLRYKYYPLNELCEFVIRIKYPKYGYPFGAYDEERDYPYAPEDIDHYRRHPCGRWVVRIGGGCGGIGAAYGWADWDTVRDNRNRLNKIIHAINYLGDADFKLRYGFEKQVRDWWEFKALEIKEVDRRERERQVLLEAAKAKEAKQKAKVEAQKEIEKKAAEAPVSTFDKDDAEYLKLERWLQEKVKEEKAKRAASVRLEVEDEDE